MTKLVYYRLDNIETSDEIIVTHGTSMHSSEVWRPIFGFEDLYEVSDRGQVKSLARKIPNSNGVGFRSVRERILKPQCGGQYQYPCVGLHRDGVATSKIVHRLVLEAFVGPCPPGMECRHLNGNVKDNRLENLAWENYHQNKLTESQVEAIRDLSSFYAQKVLGEKYKVTQSAISAIRTGKVWNRTTNQKIKIREYCEWEVEPQLERWHE